MAEKASWVERYPDAFLVFILVQSILVLAGIDFLVTIFIAELHGNIEGLVWLILFTGYLLWPGYSFYQKALWKVGAKTFVGYGILLVILAITGIALQFF